MLVSQVIKYMLRSNSVTIYCKGLSKFAELARSGKMMGGKTTRNILCVCV